MVGWESQDNPVGMTVSAVVILIAGVAIAWYGYRSAGTVTGADAIIGIAIGAVAVVAQTGAALRHKAGEPLFSGDWARRIVGMAAAVGLVWLINTYPAMAVGFGVTLVLLGIASRILLYYRASGN
ncbi:MAG: hypothetical protein ABEH88_01690 [Halobacteriales archaeon]